jgi:hypothetical protein
MQAEISSEINTPCHWFGQKQTHFLGIAIVEQMDNTVVSTYKLSHKGFAGKV